MLVSRQMRDDPADDGPGRPVIVLGDLNDAQLSNTLGILTAQPPYRLEAASTVGSRSKWGLYSVATLQELRSLRDVYYTYIHNGFTESLDHILVSQHFYDFGRHRIWSLDHSRIFNDHLECASEGTRMKLPASDHGLVCAVFDTNPCRLTVRSGSGSRLDGWLGALRPGCPGRGVVTDTRSAHQHTKTS